MSRGEFAPIGLILNHAYRVQLEEALQEDGVTEDDAIVMGKDILNPHEAESNTDRVYRIEAIEILCRRFGITCTGHTPHHSFVILITSTDQSLQSTDHDSPMEVASRWLYWMIQSNQMLR